MLFSIFTAEKNLCILHGHVFVMRKTRNANINYQLCTTKMYWNTIFAHLAIDPLKLTN